MACVVTTIHVNDAAAFFYDSKEGYYSYDLLVSELNIRQIDRHAKRYADNL